MLRNAEGEPILVGCEYQIQQTIESLGLEGADTIEINAKILITISNISISFMIGNAKAH